MAKYVDLHKQFVRLYRLNLDCEEVIKEFLMSADTIEIVRCKECKWFDEFCDERKKQVDADGRCNKIGLRRDADWFCADGERIEK